MKDSPTGHRSCRNDCFCSLNMYVRTFVDRHFGVLKLVGRSYDGCGNENIPSKQKFAVFHNYSMLYEVGEVSFHLIGTIGSLIKVEICCCGLVLWSKSQSSYLKFFRRRLATERQKNVVKCLCTCTMIIFFPYNQSCHSSVVVSVCLTP